MCISAYDTKRFMKEILIVSIDPIFGWKIIAKVVLFQENFDSRA